MKKLLVVVGTRPNFMKVSRFKEVAREYDQMEVELVHTGQHSDRNMTTVFFDQFGLRPDHFLHVPPASPNTQIARMMIGLEELFLSTRPVAVMVVGDVNSTLAGAITADRCGIPLFHLESGLRSGDRSMPEEINRILVDRIADRFFVTEESGRENLLKEGADPEKIHFVGNTMIDTMVAFADRIEASSIMKELELGNGGHILVTVHRPATVDDPGNLRKLMEILKELSNENTVIFPVHPRTQKQLDASGIFDRSGEKGRLKLIDPLDHFSFQKLLATSLCVLTDSGGIQEETTFKGVPCFTLRPNTERPVTITEGTNQLIALDRNAVIDAVARIKAGDRKKGRIPQLWDGRATERVFEVLHAVL